MNLTIDNSRYLVRQNARSVVQSKSASRPESAGQQRVAPVSPVPELPSDLEYRARQARRPYFPADQISLRSQQAIRSYSSVTEIDQRTRVSDLLGLNEYA